MPADDFPSTGAWRALARRNPTLRIIAVNLAAGVVAAIGMVGGLLALNAHGLRTLIAASPDGILAVVLLTFGFVVTFGSAAIGFGIMAAGDPDRPERRPSRRPATAVPVTEASRSHRSGLQRK